jgi:outer membrane receptor for ferrienterochelin and colicin
LLEIQTRAPSHISQEQLQHKPDKDIDEILKQSAFVQLGQHKQERIVPKFDLASIPGIKGFNFDR